jgi:hypothetical protein
MEEAAASPNAIMESLLLVEESSSDPTDSSDSYNGNTRYYALRGYQEYDGTISLHFYLEEKDFEPPSDAQLVDVENIYHDLYLRD